MNGKTVLITGATSGIGKAAATELARMGAGVVMTTRDPAGGKEAKGDIVAASCNRRVRVMDCDLASLDSVRSFCGEFRQRHDRLDVLINNAGVWMPRRQESRDGIELTFAVDYLAQFLMTNLLLDVLKNSRLARIVSTTSGLHTGSIDFGDIGHRRKYSGWTAYRQAKLAQILFTRLLARRLRGKGVTVNCYNPGMTRTNFARNSNALFRGLFKYMGKPPETGAQTLVYLASSPEVKDVTGEYFEGMRVREITPESRDMDMAKRLWEVSEEMTGLGGD